MRIGVKLRVGLNGTKRVPLWLLSLFHLSIREALTQHMTTLEQRLFHLFDPRDRKRARNLVPEKVICPRVGQVQATLASDDGTSHEVLLELSAKLLYQLDSCGYWRIAPITPGKLASNSSRPSI